MTCHTSMPRGKAVIVHFNDGRKFADKFKERTGQFVVFDSLGRVRGADICAITVIKPSGKSRAAIDALAQPTQPTYKEK